MRLESKREKEIDKQIKLLNDEKEEICRRKTIKCSHCEKRTPLHKATVIIDYWYREPYGCTGGDYWKFNQYLYFCNKCNRATRAYISSSDRIDWSKGDRFDNIKQESLNTTKVQLYFFIKKHKKYFGEVLESHNECSKMSIDELRKVNHETKQRQREKYVL